MNRFRFDCVVDMVTQHASIPMSRVNPSKKRPFWEIMRIASEDIKRGEADIAFE